MLNSLIPATSFLPPPPQPTIPTLPASPQSTIGANFAVLDDTSSQLVYDSNGWGVFSSSAPCKVCATQFDFAKLTGGSYHELSQPGSVSINFAGTGLHVYGVCPG